MPTIAFHIVRVKVSCDITTHPDERNTQRRAYAPLFPLLRKRFYNRSICEELPGRFINVLYTSTLSYRYLSGSM
jgi:hypothetical protein